jgi:hypothetical protein
MIHRLPLIQGYHSIATAWANRHSLKDARAYYWEKPPMAEELSPAVVRIGEAAGVVWSYLSAHGPTSLTVLAHGVGIPRDLLLQALGWLARENKIDIMDKGRGKIVSLR